ncbi:mannonate dehydratase [Chondrinema litorale]|uniref:mannonate dehydratase n=1 Tax=Chondrinema litorale TaxID=2994555 RepID=UPI0025430B22|nr:mannonate dehydratase [Chondrinema litorale]UZR98667.1 mannonate dehydratase [Chondrinema litorale]
MKKLLQTWRWFGPQDAVTLDEIKQTGAEGIVTALHHIPCGDVWEKEEIKKRVDAIEEKGLKWSVVESLNIHESIKTGAVQRDEMIEKYCISLKNLAACGLKVVCYNFMPVLDWTRTHLKYTLKDSSEALRYYAPALAAFDMFMLKREGAEKDFSKSVRDKAAIYFEEASNSEKERLQNTIMAGLPGTDEVFSIPEFQQFLNIYKKIDHAKLQENLKYFLERIIPTAESVGIKMCIHPDDPPFSILGLPRIASNENDLKAIVEMVDSPSNGITFCTGSLGANPKNDLPGMIARLGKHIHFIHLRNVKWEDDGSFHEADHLNGSVNMFAIMWGLIKEQAKRNASAKAVVDIPMRPDHGHQFSFDAGRNFYPGYSAIGRMRGLAELRGLESGIRGMLSFT